MEILNESNARVNILLKMSRKTKKGSFIYIYMYRAF